MSFLTRRLGRPKPPSAEIGPAAASEASASEGVVELRDERFASRVPSIFFTAHIQGSWLVPEEAPYERIDSVALPARVRHVLRERARRTLSRHSVLELPAAQDEVNLAMARPNQPVRQFTAYGSARLTVDKEDRNVAQEHLRRAQLTDLEQHDAQRRLVFLQSLLADPDLRRVWWIDRHPERLDALQDLQDQVKDLRAPNGTDRDAVRGEVFRFVDQLLTDMRTPQQREVFLRALTQALHALGSTELQQTAATWLPTRLTDSGGATA
ncbi:hypothetical protein AB0D45_06835 [Streptomyces sp. NPDC048352]|uniref:hypothetical protein n=1 Tax=Streptomyces sp. NPDC048352 TaxID=3154718 RepID=UPI00343748BD